MMSPDEKRRTLAEIDGATPDRLRETLRKLLEIHYARAAWAEAHFFDLKPRQLGEGCVHLEACELMAGALSPCSQAGCDLASFVCKIHNRKVPVQTIRSLCANCSGVGCPSCRAVQR